MQILIKLVSRVLITINEINQNTKIKTIKQKIWEKEGIPIKYQCLSFGGKNCYKKDLTLNDYNINHGTQLELNISFTSHNTI